MPEGFGLIPFDSMTLAVFVSNPSDVSFKELDVIESYLTYS